MTPPPPDDSINVRVSAELKAKLEAHAAENNKSLSQFVRDSLEALVTILDKQKDQ